jgi:ADP-ribose pyrophosphatase
MVATPGDWIVTKGSQRYPLSGKKFEARYEPVPDHPGYFKPKPQPVRTVEITKRIRYRAPWSGWHYAEPGDVMVWLSPEDTYVIHKSNFDAEYERIAGPQAAPSGSAYGRMEAPGIESVSGASLRPDPEKALIAVMDLHGVLLDPTWRNEYAHAYQKLAGGTIEAAMEWVEREAVGVEDPELFRKLAKELRIPYKQIESRFRQSRQHLQERSNPQAKEGALEFVKALHEKGVEIMVISGSPSATIRRQLEMRGFLPFIKPEHIIGRDAVQRMSGTGVFRDRAIEAIAHQFPDHRMIYFNDWTGSFDLVKRMGGRIFGMPQSSGEENELYRKILIDRGVDFLLDGWKARSWLVENLAISKEQQEAANTRKLPLATHSAREMPFLFAAPLEPKPGLMIEVSHNLRRLFYSFRDASGILQPLCDFPSQYLISPMEYIRNIIPEPLRSQIMELWNLNRRVTLFRGIATDWDRVVDQDVWAFNIDTGHLHAAEEDTELFEKMDIRTIRRAAEIGSGGGHGTKMLLERLPYLEELTFTDISLHALAATMRNIWSKFLTTKVILHPYWGKGIRSLPGNLDYMKVNPPYVPILPGEGNEDDPYRGTGLIREILEVGASKLSPDNPEASIVINISSLAQKDWDAYLKQYGHQWVIEPLGEPRTVPLKIGAIAKNPEWLDYLIREHGLVKKENPQLGEEPYEHTIQCYRLRPRLSVPEVLEEEIANYEAIEKTMREPGGPSWQWVGGTEPSPGVKRLGVFGITADPVQNGHKDLVETALRDGVEEVVVVLAFDNVNKLKASQASLAERMAMLRRTFGDNPRIHYAFSKNPRFIDFLSEVKTKRPQATPVFLMGADSFQTMAAYNSTEDFRTFIREDAEFRVYPRYGDEAHLRRLWAENAEHWPEEFTSRVRFVGLSSMPASSSLVRVLVGDDDPLWKGMVPQPVAQVIELRKLYHDRATIEARAKAYLEYSDWITTKFRSLELKELAEWLKVRPQTKALDNAQRPSGYPARSMIPEEFRSWKTEFTGYEPPEKISPKVTAKPRPKQIPKNPLGRTGLSGTGSLWNWGENEAADLYFTRENPVTGKFEFMAVRRHDNQKFSSPGGFVDPDEDALTAAIREAREEANALGNFRDAELIYDGPVDDPRNADNAWITSKVFWKHLTPEESAALDLRPDNVEVDEVKWLPFTDEVMDGLHASHPEFVRLIQARLKSNPPSFERKVTATPHRLRVSS